MIDPRKVYQLYYQCPFFSSLITRKKKLLNDQTVFETQSYLLKKSESSNFLYGNADGSGTDINKFFSQLKALSEGMETYILNQYKGQVNFKFDVFPNSLGMSFYPGFSIKEAQSKARMEAIERWALIKWWEGHLPINKTLIQDNFTFYEITTPYSDCFVILIHYHQADLHAYGFACSQDKKHAQQQALVECSRNNQVLKRLKTENIHHDKFHYREKRISFFSTNNGYQIFLAKTQQAPEKIRISHPIWMCDEEIKGEWNKYGFAYRAILDFESTLIFDHFNDDVFYF